MNDEKQALIKELMDLGIVEVANPERPPAPAARATILAARNSACPGPRPTTAAPVHRPGPAAGLRATPWHCAPGCEKASLQSP